MKLCLFSTLWPTGNLSHCFQTLLLVLAVRHDGTVQTQSVCCVCVCTVWLFVCTAAPQTSFHDSKGYPTLSPWSLVSLPSPPPTPRHSLLLKFTTYMWLSWTECCCVGVWRQDGPSHKGERYVAEKSEGRAVMSLWVLWTVCVRGVCVWTGGHYRVKATSSRQNLSVSDCCQPEPQRTFTITGVWNIYNENNCRKDWRKTDGWKVIILR